MIHRRYRRTRSNMRPAASILLLLLCSSRVVAAEASSSAPPPTPSPPTSTLSRGRGRPLSAMPKYHDGSDYAVNHSDIRNILDQNEEYVDAMGPDFFDDLGSNHLPKYMWIGCADARVPANELMGEKPGSVFVARNIANMVVATDVNLMSALQYAVNVLHVKHIIVCGHYDCGGIRASMAKTDVGPPLEMWLRNIRDVYRTHRRELDAISDPEERHRRMVEINAVEQAVNLFKTGVVQNSRVRTSQDPECKFHAPKIHVCVYNPKDGRLKRLDIDWKEYLDDINDIYDMYKDDVSMPHIRDSADGPLLDNDADKLKAMKEFFGGDDDS